MSRHSIWSLGFAFLVLFAASTGGAVPAACPEHFAGGLAPDLTKDTLKPKTTALCFQGYAVLYSGLSHTPLWVAEHLTTERVEKARAMTRKNSFHPEDHLPQEDRSELEDYRNSGYDRGHMAPSGDMPDETSQGESFSLSNLIPQDPKNNQVLWEGIETVVRSLAARTGDVYVVTGPIFQGSSVKRIGGRVLVPTQVFKAVYDQRSNGAAAYVTNNAPGMDYRVVSIIELETITGIAVFPGVPKAIKDRAMSLPPPKPHGDR